MATLSTTEVVWIAASLLGLVVHAANLLDALRDLRAWRLVGWNASRGIVARAGVRKDALRLAAQMAILVLGIDAGLRPGPAANWRNAAVLVVVLSIVATSLLDRRMRWALLRTER